MRRPPAEVRAYLAKLPREQRDALMRLRSQILAAAPGATEKLSYGMPSFFHEGGLVSMAGFTEHCSLFAGASGAALAKANGIPVASKSTLRFTPDQPLPATLVKRIVKLRVAENAARAAAQTSKRKRARRSVAVRKK